MESKEKTTAMVVVGVVAIVAILCATMIWSLSIVNEDAFNSNDDRIPTYSDADVIVVGSEKDGEFIESALDQYTDSITIQSNFENITHPTIVFITEDYTSHQEHNYLVENIRFLINHGCPVITLFESPNLLIDASNGNSSIVQDANANGLIQIKNGEHTITKWFGVSGSSEENTIKQGYIYGIYSIVDYANHTEISESEIQE